MAIHIHHYSSILYQNWYFLSKTEAESEALEFGKRRGLDVVTVCPSFVMGPILQPTVNASTLVILKLLKGTSLQRTCVVNIYLISPGQRVCRSA